MPIIVKRNGHTEKFDERKVYGSVYAACSNLHYDEMLCEKTAEEITLKIKKFAKGRKEIDSAEIRKKVQELLKEKDEELAFFYDCRI